MRGYTATETSAGRSLAESLIKQMTGGDKITAPFLYGNFFEFTPQFKLFLATNHKPKITGNDYAIWRRIRLVPFDVVIPEKDREKDLFDKLLHELPGILNWALDGCMQWQKEKCGLSLPDEVREATNEYRMEMDSIHNFLDQCVVEKDLTVETSAKDIYAAYEKWCTDAGQRIQNKIVLGKRLAAMGYENMKKRDGNYWIGLRISSDS